MPRHSQAAFVNRVKPLWIKLHSDLVAENAQDIVNSLVQVLRIPQVFLPKPRGGKRARAAKILTRHLHQAASSPPPQPAAPPADGGEGRDDPDAPMRARVASSVEKYCMGHARRAAQTLLSNDFCPDTPQLRSKLRDLHPPRQSQGPLPRLPQCPEVIVDESVLRKVIKKVANGSAASISGWTGEILEVLTRDSHIFNALLALCSAISNNQLPEQARQLVLQCWMIAPAKKKGNLDEPRPITVPETLYKIAALYAVLNRQSIEGTFAPLDQFGMGVSGGSELAVHLIQAEIERAGPGCAVVLDDKSNCFNSIDRAQCLEQLYEHEELQGLWSMANFSYGGPPSVIAYAYRGSNALEFLSRNGAKQGDGMGTLLACCGLIPVYADIKGGLNVRTIDRG